MSYKGEQGPQGRPNEITPRGHVMVERDELQIKLDKLNAFIKRHGEVQQTQRVAAYGYVYVLEHADTSLKSLGGLTYGRT